MARKKQLYPGVEAAEMKRERSRQHIDDRPDYIRTAAGIAPNYEKFKGWDDEKVLVWLNID